MSRPIYLFVTPFFPSPESWRGAFCFDLARALAAEGRYDVRVFVPGGTDAYELGGLRVCRFPWRMLPSSVLPFLFRRENARRFLERVRAEGIDPADVAVVHAHTAFFMPYAAAVKRANPDCLTLLHHWDPQSFGLNLGRLRHFWPHKFILFRQLRRLHDAMDAHIFISRRVEENFRAAPRCVERYYDDYRRQMRGLGWMRPVKVRRAIMLYNGVDRALFAPGPRQRQTSRPSETLEIGCVANFINWKDQATLVRALEILRDRGAWSAPGRRRPHVRFVGSGPLLAACQARVREQGLSDLVTFEREVRHEQLPAFYQSLDLFVLPSYFEGFGSVFTEAWASGVPFVTCRGQAMDDLLSEADRSRYTFPPRDAAALADRLEPFLGPEADFAVPRLVRGVAFEDTVPEFLAQVEAARADIRGGSRP